LHCTCGHAIIVARILAAVVIIVLVVLFGIIAIAWLAGASASADVLSRQFGTQGQQAA